MIRTLAIVAVLAGSSTAVAQTEQAHGQVAQRIRETLPSDLSLAQLTIPRRLDAAISDGAGISLRWRRVPRPGRSSILVTARAKDGAAVRAWVSMQLWQKRRVLVAARNLDSAGVIRPGDLTLESQPVSRGQGWQLTPDALVGNRVLQTVAKGTVIGDEHVALPPPIARGTSIRVVVRRHGVEVATSGTLERSARLGEVAPIRIASGRRVVRARLFASGSAELVGGGR